MDRPFIFRGGTTQLVLPVTPESYQVDYGTNVEVVNIHELGDVILMGYSTLCTVSINCLFPFQQYPFASAAGTERYVEQFRTWIEGKDELRFIVGNTGVNLPVKVERIQISERDGTNDVYAILTLREYRNLEAVQISTENHQNAQREAPELGESTDYLIKKGDTLSEICQKYYGSASKNTYDRLAQYNSIKNPHLIYTGNTLKIPQPLP